MIKREYQTRQIFYILGFSLWCFSKLLGHTLFPYQYPFLVKIISLLQYVALVFFIIKFFFEHRYSSKFILISLVLVSILLVIGLSSQQLSQFLFLILMLINIKNVNLKYIIKAQAYLLISVMALVFIGYRFGLLENFVHLARSGEKLRQSLGFRYVTFGPNMLFHLVCLWGVVREKRMKLIELFMFFLVNYYYYLRTDTKSAYYLTNLVLVTYLLLKYLNIKLNDKLLVLVERLALALSMFIPIIFVNLYNQGIPFFRTLNMLLTGRLFLGSLALRTYGIPILGQPIVWNTADYMGEIRGTFLYVDSSFLNILINFGLLFFLMLLVGFWMFSKKNPYRNIYFTVSFVMICLHSMWDPQFLEIWYNPFPIFLGILLMNNSPVSSN